MGKPCQMVLLKDMNCRLNCPEGNKTLTSIKNKIEEWQGQKVNKQDLWG
jgi:hypothetical protein